MSKYNNTMVVLFYPDILIDFLDELGNFKQKKFLHFKM